MLVSLVNYTSSTLHVLVQKPLATRSYSYPVLLTRVPPSVQEAGANTRAAFLFPSPGIQGDQ